MHSQIKYIPSSIFSATGTGSLRLLREGATAITSPEDLVSELGLTPAKKVQEVLAPEEQEVIELLAAPCSRDILLRTLKLPHGEANALLLTMELKGLITESLGEMRRCTA